MLRGVGGWGVEAQKGRGEVVREGERDGISYLAKAGSTGRLNVCPLAEVLVVGVENTPWEAGPRDGEIVLLQPTVFVCLFVFAKGKTKAAVNVLCS